MRFSFTEEQEEFRVFLRRFLETKSPTTEVRRLMDTDEGYDEAVWKQLSSELGLPAVHVPEEYGGQGFTVAELAIVVEEMGRTLLCAPYFSSAVLGTTTILEAATEEQKRTLLPPLAAGETRATLAFTEENGLWDSSGVEATATISGDGFTIDGTKSFVLDGHTADMIVVLARKPSTSGDDGLSFFTVAGDAKGLTRTLLKTTDPTRKQTRLNFENVQAELLGTEGAAAEPLTKVLDIAAICLANEMVGGAEKLRESALEYSLMRVQFGRQIGSFQTMKHKSADMLLEVELAKSAAYYAAAAAAEGDDETPALACLAKAGASQAYMQTAINTVQIHGGIGFTWDNDTHLWFKRAKSSEVFLGDPAYHRELLMHRWDV
ncbi:MAG: acyl-CoA dehydrogenase [Rhodospirillaceae bacterium]|nr:acyl-CoA dehydrogenase [Rhodospirillaceae bacterium]